MNFYFTPATRSQTASIASWTFSYVPNVSNNIPVIVTGRSPPSSGCVLMLSLTLHSFWIILMVSPPFPITRPTLSFGTLKVSVMTLPAPDPESKPSAPPGLTISSMSWRAYAIACSVPDMVTVLSPSGISSPSRVTLMRALVCSCRSLIWSPPFPITRPTCISFLLICWYRLKRIYYFDKLSKIKGNTLTTVNYKLTTKINIPRLAGTTTLTVLFPSLSFGANMDSGGASPVINSKILDFA